MTGLILLIRICRVLTRLFKLTQCLYVYGIKINKNAFTIPVFQPNKAIGYMSIPIANPFPEARVQELALFNSICNLKLPLSSSTKDS